jgi:hypothetical protein
MDTVTEEIDKITIAQEEAPIDYQQLFIEAQEEARKNKEEARKYKEEARKNKEEARKNKEEATKAQEEATKAQEEATKAQEESREYKLKMGVGSFFDSREAKLPDIEFVGSTSGASGTNHEPATFTEGEFKHINFELTEEELLEPSKVLADKTKSLKCSTETDVHFACIELVNDMIKACSLTKEIYITNELSISSCKSDLWVFTFDNYPVGSFEVKKPNLDGSSIMDNKLLLGQIFDYMMKIRSVNGMRYVFGVITDYREWRICWLNDSDAAATTAELCSLKDVENISLSRELRVSKIYKGSGGTSAEVKELSIALTSVLRKMSYYRQFRRPVELISDKRPYLKLSRYCCEWVSGINSDLKLTLKPPPKNTSNYILLRDYHGGRDGRVWLATSESGHLAVLKFLDKNADETKEKLKERAEKESKYWNKLGFESVYCCELNKSIAIIMPFCFHFDDKKDLIYNLNAWSCRSRLNEEPDSELYKNVSLLKECQDKLSEMKFNDVLQKCVHSFACNKLVHNDIASKHVAVVPIIPSNQNEAIQFVYTFIDLSDITDTDTQDEALETMKNYVADNLKIVL